MTTTYDLARQVNLRLYGDDESKFHILLTVIGELQYLRGGWYNKDILEGSGDDFITRLVGLYNGSELDVMIKHQEDSNHIMRRIRGRRRRGSMMGWLFFIDIILIGGIFTVVGASVINVLGLKRRRE